MRTKRVKESVGIGTRIARFFIYFLCIVLAIMSALPFIIMLVNTTRSTAEIDRYPFSFVPSDNLMHNYRFMMGFEQVFLRDEQGNIIYTDEYETDLDGNPVYQWVDGVEVRQYIPETEYVRLSEGRTFDPYLGFRNSLIISVCVTVIALYFSSLTAYANFAYQWKFKNALFAFILFVMMIPTQVTIIGFFHFSFSLGWTNTFWPLILPSIASPGIVFFMRQYMLTAIPIEMIEAARIDGAKEFSTFNKIVMPLLKPAVATQAIFVFVGSWNNLFLPSILLTAREMYTMPIMVQQLRGNIYNRELGAQYLGLTMTILPLFVVYFLLSKYIIAGVAIGGVKDD